MPPPIPPEVLAQKKPRSPSQREYLGAQLSRTQSFITSLQRADAEIRKDLGALRSHSRHLAKNTPYMGRYLKVLGVGVIGADGITLEADARRRRGATLEQTNTDLESAWEDWGRAATVCDRHTWAQVQRLALRTMALDGECFIRIVTGAPTPWGFALQFLDADLLDHNLNATPTNGAGAVVMGVELDGWSRPVAYHFTDPTERGLDRAYPGSVKRVRIPAEEIIHLYDPERANQTRGVPWASRVMYLLSMLSAYWEAEVAAARHEAERIAFIKEEVGAGIEPCNISPSAKATEIQSGPVTYLGLEPGQDIVTPDINHPNTAFPEFSKAMLKGVASGLCVSYASLATDLTEVSYSSIRQGELEQRDHWRETQDLMVSKLCRRVYEAWVPYAVLNGWVSIPQGLTLEDLKRSVWTPRGWDWVDPKNDAEAAEILLRNGLTTKTRLLAEQGYDLEDTFSELKKEKELAKEMGLEFEAKPVPAKPGGANAAA